MKQQINEYAHDEQGQEDIGGESGGWTQTYLAVHTGLGRPFISNVENGRKEPCLRSLEIVAIAFDMSLAQLLCRIWRPKRSQQILWR